MITRRFFVQGLSALALPLLPRLGQAYPKPEGLRLHVGDLHRAGYSCSAKVFLDGQDISCECFQFDSSEGWADCHLKEPHPISGRSRTMIRNGRTVRIRKHGRITTEPPIHEIQCMLANPRPRREYPKIDFSKISVEINQ